MLNKSKILILNLPGMPLTDSYLREIGIYQLVNYLEDNSDIILNYIDLNTYHRGSYDFISDKNLKILLSDGRMVFDNIIDNLDKIFTVSDYNYIFLNIFRSEQFDFLEKILDFINNNKVIGIGRISNYGSFMTPNFLKIKNKYPYFDYIDNQNFPENDFINLLNKKMGVSIKMFNSIFELKINKEYNFDNKLFLSYELSRGCLNKCFYCANSTGDLKIKSYKDCYNELKYLIKITGLKKIIFTHSQINSSYLKGDLVKLLALIIKENWGIKWTSYMVTDGKIKEKHFELFRKSGCSLLSIGVESFLDKFLQMIGKTSLNNIIRDLVLIKKNDINTLVHLIYGFPGEEIDDVIKNILNINRLRKYINFANLSYLEIPINKIDTNEKLIDKETFNIYSNYNSIIGFKGKRGIDKTIFAHYLNSFKKMKIRLSTENFNFNDNNSSVYLNSMEYN